MNDAELKEIEERAAFIVRNGGLGTFIKVLVLARTDVPALIAEVRRLQSQIALAKSMYPAILDEAWDE